MGARISRPAEPALESISYNEAKALMRPFDVLLFRGGDFISDGISRIEKATTRVGAFTHAALIISGACLDFPFLTQDSYTSKPDHLYSWEITMSGKLNDGVTDIFGKSFLGVQLRDLDEVIKATLSNPKASVAWLPLNRSKSDYSTITNETRLRATALYLQTYEAPYEIYPCVLLAAACPRFRCCSTKGTKRFFCSEFVAYILRSIGHLPPTVKVENVLPVDFLPGVDTDGELINCCEEPRYLTLPCVQDSIGK